MVKSDKSIIRDLVKKADIIHFHHFMEMEFYNPFLINFLKETKPECKLLRHFHTDKEYISRTDLDFNKYYPNDKLPRVVIPHYPERTFLDCSILPNILPINESYCMPKDVNNTKPIVVYSASNRTSYKQERWATKGNLKKRNSTNIQNADIVIGDIVTGSYHLTELEALSMGKPTLTYLDGRSVMTFINTFKTKDIPFVNVNIDNLEYALCDLVKNKNLCRNIGNFSREWMEKFYDDKVLIKSFTNIYDKLLNGENIVREGYPEHKDAKEFLYNRVYDYNWMRITE